MSTLAAFDLRRPAPLAPLSAPASERAVEQLPIPLTSFVGRDRELDAVREMLLRPDVRLLTLTGPGGVGKTRLALRILPTLQPSFQGGVWFVELAPVADPALVLAAVAATLGVRNPGGRRFVDLLAVTIGDARTRITLDNLEHVADAAPGSTAPSPGATPRRTRPGPRRWAVSESSPSSSRRSRRRRPRCARASHSAWPAANRWGRHAPSSSWGSSRRGAASREP